MSAVRLEINDKASIVIGRRPIYGRISEVGVKGIQGTRWSGRTDLVTLMYISGKGKNYGWAEITVAPEHVERLGQ